MNKLIEDINLVLIKHFNNYPILDHLKSKEITQDKLIEFILHYEKSLGEL